VVDAILRYALLLKDIEQSDRIYRVARLLTATVIGAASMFGAGISLESCVVPAVLAMACTLTARAFEASPSTNNHRVLDLPLLVTGSLPTLAILLALLASVLLAYFTDDATHIMTRLSEANAVVLTCNVICTAVAIELGSSTLIYSGRDAQDQDGDQSSALVAKPNTAAQISMAGMTAVLAQTAQCSLDPLLFQTAMYFLCIAFVLDYSSITELIDVVQPSPNGGAVTMPSDKQTMSGNSYMSLKETDDDAEDNRGQPFKQGPSDRRQRLQFARSAQSSIQYIWKSALAVGFIMILWGTVVRNILVMEPWGYPLRPSTLQPSLDLAYTPSTDLDVVISMYKEPMSYIRSIMHLLHDVPYVAHRSPRLIIYTKNEDANLDEIRRETNASEVFRLDNVAREGSTYLYHIIRNWDTLAHQTIFTQAEMHDHHIVKGQLQTSFGPDTGMLGLGSEGKTSCDCNACEDKWDWREPANIIQDIYGSVSGNQSCDSILLSYKGQFAASARRIRGAPQSAYRDMYDALVDPTSWAHSKNYTDLHANYKDPNSLNAPYYGYTVERMWCVLLQCSDPDAASPPSTERQGARFANVVSDCMCFDRR